MKMSRRTLLPMIVTLVAVVGLTACGSDDKTSTDTDSSSTTTTKAAARRTATAIKTATATRTSARSSSTLQGKTVYTFTKDGEAVDVRRHLSRGVAGRAPAGRLGLRHRTGRRDRPRHRVDRSPRRAGHESAGSRSTRSRAIPPRVTSTANDVEGFGGLWQVVVVGSDSGGAGAGGRRAGTDTSTTTAVDGYDDGY